MQIIYTANNHIHELWESFEKSHILFLQMRCLTMNQYLLKCEKGRHQTSTKMIRKKVGTPYKFDFGLSMDPFSNMYSEDTQKNDNHKL